jgi:hypothetical protein
MRKAVDFLTTGIKWLKALWLTDDSLFSTAFGS